MTVENNSDNKIRNNDTNNYTNREIKEQKGNSGRNKMNKILKELLSTGLYLLSIFIVTWLIVTYVGQRTEVEGQSMEPMLQNGDNLITDKITYRFRDPERFEIVVFPFKYEESTYFIKRVIGLPGETVWIDEDGTIYINGEVLEENYGKEVIRPDRIGRACVPITLGEDEYFVMGDNRNDSSDSRTEMVGNVKKSDILGRAFMRIWPLSKFGILKHK